jgi:hypothetical protein
MQKATKLLDERGQQAALALPPRLLENDLFIERFFDRHATT